MSERLTIFCNSFFFFSFVFFLVTWTKDGQPLEESTKVVPSSDGKRKFKLEINNLNAADVGQYGVKLTGKKVETSASFSLNVTTTV